MPVFISEHIGTWLHGDARF